MSAKRRAAPTPSMPREQPNSEFAKKEIAFEKHFPMEDMKEREECGWTLQYLKKNNYIALGLAYEDEIYPRLVRLFYQNLKYGVEDELDYFEFTIDGFHRRITLKDMGEITNLPVEFDVENCPYLSPPFVFPEDQGIFDFLLKNFSEDGTRGKGESIILSALPETLWLLDRILRENVFPLGHHSERRSEMLYALYSAHTGHFYSMPSLFMRGIIKMGQEIWGKTPMGKTRPLPYGFLITAILRYSEYPLDRREQQMHVDPYLPLSAWIASYGRLALAKKKRRAQREHREETAADTSTAPTPAPRPTQRPSTSTADTDIIERLTRVEEHQATLQEEHERILRGQRKIRRDQRRTDSIIRALARHSIGDDYQARIDTYESEVAQRGKATAAAEDSEGSDYEDEESSSESESD